jgi:hypothetical protein
LQADPRLLISVERAGVYGSIEMKNLAQPSIRRDAFLEKISVLTLGFVSMFAAACGDANEPPEANDLEAAGEAITGGWKTLTLINGWQNFHTSSYPPAVGIVNGVVTFRGAIKATNPTSPVAFKLDGSAFAAYRPDPSNAAFLRTVMNGSVGGSLFWNPFFDTNLVTDQMSVYQDGVPTTTVGSAAKAFTSLEGVSYDRVGGTPIDHDDAWTTNYGFRENLWACNGGCGAYVKLVDGFVRFQGLLTKLDANDYNGYLFTLTDPSLVPAHNVTVPVNLGGSANQSWGALTIYTTGDVYVNGNPPAANSSTSFEGVSYSKTLSGNVTLPLSNGWMPYSGRSVRVGKYGDVVRFQGAIKNGTSGTLGTLALAYRPARTVRVVGVAYGAVPVTIVINTSGVMTFEGVPLEVGALFLSLDGVSFAL